MGTMKTWWDNQIDNITKTKKHFIYGMVCLWELPLITYAIFGISWQLFIFGIGSWFWIPIIYEVGQWDLTTISNIGKWLKNKLIDSILDVVAAWIGSGIIVLIILVIIGGSK